MNDAVSAPPRLTRSAVAGATAYLDRWLEFRRRYERVPGVQAAVLFDGEVLGECAHGLADVESGVAMTSRHLFRIASHSKTFTATAVLQLVERGDVRLDDPVSQWLPYLAGTGLAAVTIRELLSHAGGVVRDGHAADHWQLATPFPDDEGLRAIAVHEADVLARNRRFKYSNVGFSLLGQVVAAASEQPYATYVDEHIVARLGLDDSGPELAPRRFDDAATGYSSLALGERRLPIGHVDARAMAAATGWYSTAADVVRYAAAHFLGDERLLSDDSKRMMQRTEWQVDGTPTAYGLGFGISTIGGRRLLGHGGAYPGYITRTFFDPVDRLAVSVLTNAIDGPALPMATAAIQLIDLAASSEPDPHLAAGVGVAASFCGRFANLWGVFDVTELGGRLHIIDPTQPDPVAARSRVEIVDADTLLLADAPGYGAPGERMLFERDDTGAVVAVRGGLTSYPAAAVEAATAGVDRVTVGHPLLTRSRERH